MAFIDLFFGKNPKDNAVVIRSVHGIEASQSVPCAVSLVKYFHAKGFIVFIQGIDHKSGKEFHVLQVCMKPEDYAKVSDADKNKLSDIFDAAYKSFLDNRG